MECICIEICVFSITRIRLSSRINEIELYTNAWNVLAIKSVDRYES